MAAIWSKRTGVTTSWNRKRVWAFLLKEDGFYLLLEDGGKIVLEDSAYVATDWTKRTIPA